MQAPQTQGTINEWNQRQHDPSRRSKIDHLPDPSYATTMRPVLALALSSLCTLTSCASRQPEPQRAKHILRSGQQTRNLDHFGDDLDHAVEIAEGIFQARAVGNAHMIVTSAGNVIVDTGLPKEAKRQKQLLQKANDGPVKYVVITHGHMDHVGGTKQWNGDGVEVIAHENFVDTQRYLKDLAPFFLRRNRVFYPHSVPDVDRMLTRLAVEMLYPTFEPTRLIGETFRFELGGTRFEVIPTPSAEGEDSISVWLPDRKILFTGDAFGPLFPMFPNLYTIRGEKFRFALPYIQTLDRMIALEPEMIVPSHFEPIRGAERIRKDLQRMRDATAYVHDATIAGMNDGKDVHTLMREIQLPKHLRLSEGHSKVPWTVRGIWEGYAGWFHFRSTTELYGVPASAVAPDLVDLAGGAGAIATRADRHVAAGRPLEALHLTDIALAAAPENKAALQVRLRALTVLLERSGDENHSEVMWLRHQMTTTGEALDR